MLNNVDDFDKITEEYEDRLFDLVMKDVEKIDGKKLLEEYEPYKNDPENIPSQESIARFTKLLDKEIKLSKKSKHKKSMSWVMRKVAIAVIALIVVFSSAMLTVDAFRIQVLNFLINIETKYTSVQLGDSGNSDSQALDVNWTDAYVPTYIPARFEITNVSNTSTLKQIIYTNIDDNSLTVIYCEYDSGTTLGFDTEDATYIQKTKINGTDGTLSTKNDTVTVSWTLDDHLFSIQGQISSEDALKLAQSVKLKNN